MLSTSLGVVVQLFQVDVGLEEAVEEDQSVGAGVGQLLGHPARRAERGPDLDRQGDRRPTSLTSRRGPGTAIRPLGRWPRVAGDEIDVQLQGVGPGFLDQLGVANPAAAGDAVEARDHRHGDGLLRLADQLQVGVRPHPVLVLAGEVREGLCETVGPELLHAVKLDLVVLDLLLEQRGEHGRGRAGVLQRRR